jgi:hypothetical protein
LFFSLLSRLPLFPPFNLPAETARKWSCLFVEKLLGKIKKFVGGKKKGHYIEEAQIADLIDAAGVVYGCVCTTATTPGDNNMGY